MRFKLTHIAAITAIGLCASAAHASLTLLESEDYPGTGLGANNTILTLQSPGASSLEFGTVGRVAGTNELLITGSRVLRGASQTQTRTISQLGVTTAANLRVIFDPQEPGNERRRSINLRDLRLNAFDETGTSVFSASLDQANYFFDDVSAGAGNSGFSFGLTAPEAAQLQAVFDPTLQIGLSARATMAEGRFETFFVAPPPIPEPETYALMLAGLGLLGFASRRKKRIGQR